MLKTCSIFVMITLCFLAAATYATGTYNDGNGSAEDPFQINTPEQLNELGLHSEDWDKHFVLTDDIDLIGYTGSQFKIIGGALNNVNVYGESVVGSLVGRMCGGIVSNCCVTGGSISGTKSTFGGLIGIVGDGGAVYDCHAYAYVEASGPSPGGSIGGLVGSTWESGIISNSYATGDVRWKQGQYTNMAGGLVGFNDAGVTIENCYATGFVHTSGTIYGTTEYAGGLVGYNSGVILNSYARGEVDGDKYCGGFVGNNSCSASISKCYSTGRVSGISDVGGGNRPLSSILCNLATVSN